MKELKEIKDGAFWRFIDGYGYNYQKAKILWRSKKCSWNIIRLSYGIRNSKIPQRFPIWNMSDNSTRSLMLGLGFWFVQFDYQRRKSFRQGNGRYIPKSYWGRRLWQLLF